MRRRRGDSGRGRGQGDGDWRGGFEVRRESGEVMEEGEKKVSCIFSASPFRRVFPGCKVGER